MKLHHYHTKSNVAQHDIITLTTEITNLTLNDSWKGTVRQFLSHFKEKLRLLDSLVPVSDQLPEVTRLTFLQRAVQQNHDLRQIHVMDSVWRFKTDSTEALTFDTYYNLLWDAAHQYDLHQTKKGPQRKAFSSHQEDINDVDEYANAEEQFPTDPETVEHSPYSDVGNAYLQALTREKLYIVGGPEFEELQGHVLVMYKALYGTRSGGACWHDKFFDILHDMGFKPSKADPDIWMKSSKDGSHYEYIAVYVDDLAICMKDPKSFCDTLKEKYKLKLKGVGPINYHLGCGYTRDEDGTLVADPRKYVEKILESMKKPLEKNQR